MISVITKLLAGLAPVAKGSVAVATLQTQSREYKQKFLAQVIVGVLYAFGVMDLTEQDLMVALGGVEGLYLVFRKLLPSSTPAVSP